VRSQIETTGSRTTHIRRRMYATDVLHRRRFEQYYFSVTYFLALLGVSTQEQHNNGNLVIINVRSREKVPLPTTNPLLCKSKSQRAFTSHDN
jgi:hypothetical protein